MTWSALKPKEARTTSKAVFTGTSANTYVKIPLTASSKDVPVITEGNLDNDFQFPKYRLKRQRRKEVKNRVIQGKANNLGDKVKGAPEPDRFLFIYCVDKHTVVDDLQQLIVDAGFTVCALECVSKPEAKFSSFKLTVPVSQFKRLFDSSLWPEGIHVRKFIVPNKGSASQVGK